MSMFEHWDNLARVQGLIINRCKILAQLVPGASFSLAVRSRRYVLTCGGVEICSCALHDLAESESMYTTVDRLCDVVWHLSRLGCIVH